MSMKVEIRENKLCIEIDLEKPTPSASGKTLVVASTRGNAVFQPRFGRICCTLSKASS